MKRLWEICCWAFLVSLVYAYVAASNSPRAKFKECLDRAETEAEIELCSERY
jgi:hypothetical protein